MPVQGFRRSHLDAIATQRLLARMESHLRAPDELRTTELTFINTECNAARTAKRLFAHRNSIVRRLARADELLPRPISDNAVQIAVALEVVRWRGS